MTRRRSSPLLRALWVAWAASCGCAQPLSDVQLIVWQPFGVAGDALDAADGLELTVETDEVEATRSFARAADVRVGGVVAPVGGGEARFTLRAAEALGRAAVFVRPEVPEVQATMVFASTDTIHPHTEEPTDNRVGTTACLDPVGRMLVASGLSGAALRPGTLVVDPVERRVRAGPALDVLRQRAGCVAGEDVVWLFGGCDEDAAPRDDLLRAEGLGEDDAFVRVATTPGAGCGASLALLEGGGLALNYGDQVEVRDADGVAVTPPLPLDPPRFGATVVPFPGEDRFVVSGGVDEIGEAVPGSVVVLVDAGALLEVNTAPGVLAAADGEQVFVIDGDDVLRLNSDGGTEIAADAELPAGFVPARMVAADGVVSLLGEDGRDVRVAGARLGAFALPLARPGGYLFADPGGALFLVGGGAPGVDVLVLE